MSSCGQLRRRRRNLTARAALAAALAWAAGATAAPEPPADLREALGMQGDPVRGRRAFEPCVICHRRDAFGRANLGTPRLAGQHASVIVKQVADIRTGARLNPPMKEIVDNASLTPRVLADIAAHLQALPMEPSAMVGPGTALERGQAIHQRDCAACHGAQGEGQAATFRPLLAAQHYEYLLREMILIRDGGRGNSDPEMVRIVKGMPQPDLEAVADYLSRLPAPRR